MQTRNRNAFTTIHTEGALLPVDLLQRISENDSNLEGLNPESYHLAPGEKLNEAINRSWNRLNGLWGAFQTARGRLGVNDAGTTLTRERWLLPLFQELGFGRLSTSKAVDIKGKSYAISHRWQNVPLHLVGCGLELDKRTPGAAGASRISPHSLLQEYLNRSEEALWGLLSNGLSLRILRDNATLTRQAYLDFDLESMFDGEVYSDFVLLWLVCHQSRFEVNGEQGTSHAMTDCVLEQWSKSAQDLGTRALEDLRGGVEKAIVSLGQGFLKHTLNTELRARLKVGELATQDYYRQLLRLVYRLIFLFVAEDRDLLLLPNASDKEKKRYHAYYSTARLRNLAQRQRGSRHHDRYEALRLVMRLLGSDKGCPELAIPALGGFLFDERFTSDLNKAMLDNFALFTAVRCLAFIEDGKTNRAVDFRNLGSEELGSVYESLLELHPILHIEAGTFELSTAAGNERKKTGSYYTPTSLIKVLLDSALDPVIENRLKDKTNADEQEQALLDLKVCDPACGSGHFLIAAAHRIAGMLALVRTGGDEPPPNEIRRAIRDAIRHCIYGVDINPMAVELCKVNLWLESIEPGKPLSFLDAHIKCGNSLVGVGPKMDLDQLEVPDEAFSPVTGDNKATAMLLKKRNKQEREGQESLFVNTVKTTGDWDKWLVLRAHEVEVMPEDSAVLVQAKADAYRILSESTEYRKKRLAADLWTASFFWNIEVQGKSVFEVRAPTQGQLRRLRGGHEVQAGLLEEVENLCKSISFFHWPLEFVEVAAQDGFNCVLGNPPWERIKLQEGEFFGVRDPEIATALTKDARQKLIDQLPFSNPSLDIAFKQAKHAVDATGKFIRESKRFPYSSTGDINTYSLFIEHARNNISGKGYVGIIVPTGIVTDDMQKDFFKDLMEKNSLVQFIGFENEEFIFLGIANVVRFCTLVLAGQNASIEDPKFSFYLRRLEQLHEKERFFEVSPQILSLLNPNTLTCPVFRTRKDAELTKKIFRELPIIHDERTGINPWGITFTRMYDMAKDSQLFSTSGFINAVQIYEAKMFWHFDHRFSSYEFKGKLVGKGGRGLPDLPLEMHQNPNYTLVPQYWVNKDDAESRIPGYWTKKWLIAFRGITSAKLERTAVFSIVPRCGLVDTAPVLFLDDIYIRLTNCFLANVNSMTFDYISRQKVAGTHLNYFLVKQIPIIPPDSYTDTHISYITPRVLELIYTAYDLKPYAEDMGYHGKPFHWDEEHRALLRGELDAYYARLYGLNHKQLRYILDPADLTKRELEDILDPWEEVSDPLDAVGYNQRCTTSNFPGETFRVLKEKEIIKFGEYRTRRLVLEAWDRLEGVDLGNRDGDQEQGVQVEPKQKDNHIFQPQPPTQTKPALVQERPSIPIKPPAPMKKDVDTPPGQLTLTDFGLYKCGVCGKLVIGYDRENHTLEVHKGKDVEWKKVR